MIRIGIIGIGFMGMMHFLASKKLKGGKATAIASRDPKKRAGDWTRIKGNFGPAGRQEDLTGVKAFASTDELIADPEIDLVDVCLPGDLHAQTAIRALESGKHVLVEKPIALDAASARRMVEAANRANRKLLVAHVLPFFSDFKLALEAVRTGKYGKTLAAHFRRHTSKRDWSDPSMAVSRTGGPIIDLHIHDTHFICLAFGVPKQVLSAGIVEDDLVHFVSTQYLFDAGGPVVSATSGALSQASREFTHGYEIYFEWATIHYEGGSPLTIYQPGSVERPEMPPTDPVDTFRDELEYAVSAASGEGPNDLLDGAIACRALELCLKEDESVRTGRPVAVA